VIKKTRAYVKEKEKQRTKNKKNQGTNDRRTEENPH
jgi:hypothetical protein